MLLATTQRAIGFVVLAVVAIGFIVWLFVNLRSGRDEIGAEIELAANRRPGTPDEELEGKRLNVALFSALGLLAIIAVGCLPPRLWRSSGTAVTRTAQ